MSMPAPTPVIGEPRSRADLQTVVGPTLHSAPHPRSITPSPGGEPSPAFPFPSPAGRPPLAIFVESVALGLDCRDPLGMLPFTLVQGRLPWRPLPSGAGFRAAFAPSRMHVRL
jgi:hypothetical protein